MKWWTTFTRKGNSVHRTKAQRIAIAVMVAAVAVLAGCASPAGRESMSVPTAATTKKYPYSVSVEAKGGAETGAMDSSNISNADLKAAIESSITHSSLFKSVLQGKAGDYELTVTVTQLSKPIFGASFTVMLEAGWVLIKATDKSIVLRQVVKSQHTASMGDSLAAVTRLRLAVEGAARSNITQGMQAIAALNL